MMYDVSYHLPGDLTGNCLGVFVVTVITQRYKYKQYIQIHIKKRFLKNMLKGYMM